MFHPYYSYLLFGIFRAKRCASVSITRVNFPPNSPLRVYRCTEEVVESRFNIAVISTVQSIHIISGMTMTMNKLRPIPFLLKCEEQPLNDPWFRKVVLDVFLIVALYFLSVLLDESSILKSPINNLVFYMYIHSHSNNNSRSIDWIEINHSQFNVRGIMEMRVQQPSSIEVPLLFI